MFLGMITTIKQKIINICINGKSQRNKHKKSNIFFFFFFDDISNIKNFHSNLLKIDKKSHIDIDIYYIGYITIKKLSDCENIHSVNCLCLKLILLSDILKKKMAKNI